MNDPPSLYRDPDYQVAAGWPFTAQQQASEGNLQAILYLAQAAFSNNNNAAALKYYRKAAREFNNLEATVNVIKMYENGLGCDVDLVKTCQWMKKVLIAIESIPDQWTHPMIRRDVIVSYGWYMLGAKTAKREGRPQIELPEKLQNIKDGVKWLERAADIGERDVASNLGNMFMTGGHPKIPIDYEKGMKLFEKAAELGDGKCAYQLSIAYMVGIIPVNNEKHKFWLRKAQELGYEEAERMAIGHAQGPIGISRKKAMKQIKKLEREDQIEDLLTIDESRKCYNPTCDAMETPGEPLFQVCVACRHVKYCSKECQRAHWRSGHKQDCPKLKEAKERAKKMNIDMIKNRIVDG